MLSIIIYCLFFVIILKFKYIYIFFRFFLIVIILFLILKTKYLKMNSNSFYKIKKITKKINKYDKEFFIFYIRFKVTPSSLLLLLLLLLLPLRFLLFDGCC
jgi:hypothetical protein